MHLRRLGPVLALVGVLSTAACGSTAVTTGGGVQAGPLATADGLGGPATAGTEADPGNAGTAVGPVGGAAGVVGGTATAPGPVQGVATGPGALTSGPAEPATTGARRDAHGTLQGPGVSDTTVTIGITYTANGDAANAALGAGGIKQGDERREAQAIVDDINAHGGVAGRKLIALFHGYDATSADTHEAQDQAACEDFTRDHKVFAVAASGLSDNLQACMRKAGVLQVFSGDIIDYDRAFFQQYPNYFDAGTLSQDRMMAALVPSLERQGWFGGWSSVTGGPSKDTPVKIGILSVERPQWERPLQKVLLPLLAKSGHPVDPADIYRVKPDDSFSEAGATVADIQSSALRFRNDGVTHVIFLDATGALTLFFAQNAKDQHYYPRFGGNSGGGWQALVDAGVLDPAQLKGAFGVGWLPNLDLTATAAKRFAGPGTAACLEIMRKSGFTFADANSASIAMSACDELHLIADGINRAGTSITLGTVEAGIHALGGKFRTAGLPRTFFSPTRHDGADLVFDLKWDEGCNCSAYTDNGHQVR